MTDIYPYQVKELSWLSFNHRVLQEAADPDVPLYERIKFLAIYSSNLDEFYRVRVASLLNLARLKKEELKKRVDFNPLTVLNQIQAVVQKQQEEFGEIWAKQILPELEYHDIFLYQGEVLHETHRKEINRYFKSKVLSYLQPVFIREGERGSHFLDSRTLYFAVSLQTGEPGQEQMNYYAYVNIPSGELPRYVRLSSINNCHYIIPLDEIIRMNLHVLFPFYTILGCHSIKINRDEDIAIDDEYSGDLIRKIKQQLEKRKQGAPTRFLYDATMNNRVRDIFTAAFGIQEHEMVAGGRYHNLFDLSTLPNPLKPELANEPMPPLTIEALEESDSIFQTIDSGDHLLNYPYHSFDYVLRFFNEAAVDRYVTEIKVALYRVTTRSPIVNALISAARNGKQVTVFVEAKARFDEANNLQWAEAMEKAGVCIIYSIPGLKVHAKMAVVTRIDSTGLKKRYAYLSTGNFNETTARLYADEGFFTCERPLTRELDKLFKYLKTKRPESSFENLLVSQFNMKKKLLRLIDREILYAKTGKPARIILKLNGLDEKELIGKLYEAGMAGVSVTLIVRGICTLIPGLPGLSENITVYRLVDRFLEHSRILFFHNNGREDIFLSSADWMNRNINGRIEIAFPIQHPEMKQTIRQALEFQLSDNQKLVRIDNDLKNIPVRTEAASRQRAQYRMYEWLLNKEHNSQAVVLA